MPVIQYVMPSKNKALKKLLHFYWEVCPKYDDNGKAILQETDKSVRAKATNKKDGKLVKIHTGKRKAKEKKVTSNRETEEQGGEGRVRAGRLGLQP